MNLRDKIFHFGIYGQKITTLSESEIHEAANLDYVELLTPDELEIFRKDFSLTPFATLKNRINEIKHSNDIAFDDCYVRMNLQAWRAYLLGSSFITKNKFYFFIADYLIKNPEFVPLSKLRSMFNIDPKSLFYICKKLKERNLIAEEKKVKDSEIKIINVYDRTTTDENIQEPENIQNSNLSSLIYFNNMSFLDQLKYHVNRAENGIGSKELSLICGLKSKTALRHIQRLCDIFPNQYKLVSSVDQKHTAFKVFSIENLNQRNQRKFEGMTDSQPKSQDLLLSSKDRQEALKILAQKYRFFPLSKEIINEIKQMTGYPYEIDRKNLLKNAKEANLQVFKLDKEYKFKYIISLSEYTESSIRNYFNRHSTKVKDEKLLKTLKKELIQNEKLITRDNGYCDVSEFSRTEFYKFLVDLNIERFHFDYEIVGQLPVSLFYKLIKIKKFLFKAKCAYEICNNIHSHLTEKTKEKLSYLETKEMYVDELEPKRLTEGILKAIEILDEVDFKSYIDSLSDTLQEYLREVSKPLKFMKKLKALQKKSLIEIQIDDANRIFVTVIKDSKYLEKKNSLLFPIQNTYNIRAQYINLMKHSTLETFSKDSEEVIDNNFDRSEQRVLYDSLKEFYRDYKASEQESNTLSIEYQKIYLTIKKMLVFQIPIAFEKLKDYDHSDVIDTLKYMSRNEIISGFRSKSSFDNIIINSKFKNYVSETKYDEVPEDIVYFTELYPKILNIVSSAGSIDFDQIIFKSKFLEAFELQMFFKTFPDDFNIKSVDGFLFVSMATIHDPFE